MCSVRVFSWFHPRKPIGKRPLEILEMSPVLVSWVGALAVFTVVDDPS